LDNALCTLADVHRRCSGLCDDCLKLIIVYDASLLLMLVMKL
jgi:hypothetical protein